MKKLLTLLTISTLTLSGIVAGGGVIYWPIILIKFYQQTIISNKNKKRQTLN
ncbi:hypothetical protein V2P32_00940 [Mycoplasma sp. 06067-C1-B144P-99-0482-3]|uniref:hypothetical protein n=1 Tax=Mycoplasma sp. 06067-C1-B144P-99-0482-3 TaxID=3117438 RepID=UPI003DA6752F